MRSPEFIHTIDRTFLNMMEVMAFTFGEPLPGWGYEAEPSNPSVHPAPVLLAAMRYSGYRSGVVAIYMPQPLCEELAANMLGVHPGEDATGSLPGDALKELLNVVCGQLVTELGGNTSLFRLSIPELREVPASAVPVLGPELGVHRFRMDADSGSHVATLIFSGWVLG